MGSKTGFEPGQHWWGGGGGEFSHLLAPRHPKMIFFDSLLAASHYIIRLEAN